MKQGIAAKFKQLLKVMNIIIKIQMAFKVFDAICKFIDTCNNIFLQIKKDNQIVLRIPLTVAAILIIFMFWIVIPTALISLFMDIEFYIHSNNVNINMIEVNKVLSKASEYARNIKEKIIRVIKMTKILIVEDEEKLARFIELELKLEGYEVVKQVMQNRS